MSSTLEYRINSRSKKLRNASEGSKKYEDGINYLLDCLPYIQEFEYEKTRDLAVNTRSSVPGDDGMTAGPTGGPTGPSCEGSSPTAAVGAHDIGSYVEVGPGRDTKRVFNEYMAFIEHDEAAMMRVSSAFHTMESGSKNLQESIKRRVVPSRSDKALASGEHDHCPCGGRLLVDERASQYVCTSCGLCSMYVENGVKSLTHTEQLERGSRKIFTYKRTSHFLETLASVQGRQSAVIPDTVLEQVNGEILKYRLSHDELTTAHIRSFLKRLGLSRFYDNASLIRNLIVGKTTDTIPSGIESQLLHMFIAIQKPFDDVCERGRKNMLRYGYISYKLLELMGDEGQPYLHLFPLLKSKSKLAAHDATWKRICNSVGWKFIPTV